MASLSSSSTFDEAMAVYRDNAGYDEDGSILKCKAFVTACRHLLILIPKRVSHANRSEEIEIAPEMILEQMKAAKVWLTSAAAGMLGGQTTFADFSDFRN